MRASGSIAEWRIAELRAAIPAKVFSATASTSVSSVVWEHKAHAAAIRMSERNIGLLF
jgi:hypothetical protein